MCVFLHLHLTCHCECQKDAKRMGNKPRGVQGNGYCQLLAIYVFVCVCVCVYVSVSACVCLQLTYGFFSVFSWFSCCKFCMKYFIRNVLHCIVYLCVLPATNTNCTCLNSHRAAGDVYSSFFASPRLLTQSKSQAVCKLALSRLIGVLLTAYKIYIKL